MDSVQARARFAGARVARLASVRPDGQPHLVPVVFAVEREIIYSAVDAKPKRSPRLARLANIAAHPQVSLLVDHYAEDWSTLWWVRADGDGRILDLEDPEARRAVARLAGRYPQQQIVGAVLAVDVARWVGWSAVS